MRGVHLKSTHSAKDRCGSTYCATLSLASTFTSSLTRPVFDKLAAQTQLCPLTPTHARAHTVNDQRSYNQRRQTRGLTTHNPINNTRRSQSTVHGRDDREAAEVTHMFLPSSLAAYRLRGPLMRARPVERARFAPAFCCCAGVSRFGSDHPPVAHSLTHTVYRRPLLSRGII